MKYRFWIWLLLGAAPLLIYPIVLLANVMSLAAQPSSQPVPILLQLSSKAFLWSSTLYPIVYLYYARKAIANSKQGDSRTAVTMSLLPLVYLILVLIFLCAWFATDS
jgi:hypothetical protein